jgi:hypothetical protein
MKISFGSLLFVAALALAFVPTTPAPVLAHVCMDFPTSRVGAECTRRSPQKMGSCPVQRSENINVFRPGETISVRIRETVNHPSHYRIAFNPDGESFPDPLRIDDIRTNDPIILKDGITDEEAEIQEIEITFPNRTCENCTLQLIQVMHDKQANGFGGASGGANDNDDMYYSCADIALRGTPVAAAVAEPEAQPSGRSRLPILALVGAGAMLLIGGVRRSRGR